MLETEIDETVDALYVTSGRCFYSLHDTMAADPTVNLSPVERIIVTARLRAWADHIEKNGMTV